MQGHPHRTALHQSKHGVTNYIVSMRMLNNQVNELLNLYVAHGALPTTGMRGNLIDPDPLKIALLPIADLDDTLRMSSER